jgi:hypothetical protein
MAAAQSLWPSSSERVRAAEAATAAQASAADAGEHLLHLYDDGDQFGALLAEFVATGIANGEATIVIATTPHLAALDDALRDRNIDVGAMLLQNRYLPLDAGAALEKFMRDGQPDAGLFLRMVTDLMERARRGGCRVRAFGEMVALLWARGEQAATLRLEHLWHALCRREGLLLLCAYPRAAFAGGRRPALAAIGAAHSREVRLA